MLDNLLLLMRKFVSVDKKNDNFSNFVSRQVVIKFLASQNVYKDQEINDVRVTMSNGLFLILVVMAYQK